MSSFTAAHVQSVPPIRPAGSPAPQPPRAWFNLNLLPDEVREAAEAFQAATRTALDRIYSNVEDMYQENPLPAGWHYEVHFDDAFAFPHIPAYTYTITPVPDDPLIARLVLREE